MSRFPLVTISRRAWRNVLAYIAAQPRDEHALQDETAGLLVGRYTRAGIRVHHFFPYPKIETSVRGVTLSDANEQYAQKAVHDGYPGLEKVGDWHTHPYDEACLSAQLPQISDVDESTLPEGEYGVVFAVLPASEASHGFLKSGEFHLVREISGYAVRVEGWMRRKKKVKPCRMVLRSF